MTDRHEHLDEGMIHAWLDGALSPDESSRMESQASACEECGARVAEARGLIAASSRILTSLDAVPAGVIPGTRSGGDQLAALRARRQAAARRWWQDRRIVVAASLVLVAGVSRLAWQTRSEPGATAPSAFADAAKATDSQMTVNAPPPTATAPAPAANQESARELKASAPTEVSTRVARAVDSTRSEKVADAPTTLSRRAAAANEARRTDSNVVAGAGSARADSTVVAQSPPRRLDIQQQRQALGGATRQAQLGFSRDSAPRALTAPAPAPASGEQLRLNAVVPTGAAASRADAAAARCYLVRIASVVDTVRLLNQQVPVLSDPAWYRATASGTLRDSTLAWRSIDSVTVELRRGNGADSTAIRFGTAGASPNIRAESGARVLTSLRINCP